MTKVYFDGSFMPESRLMFAAMQVEGENFLFATGTGNSSTEAEWVAAFATLEWCYHLGLKKPMVIGDSDNVLLTLMPRHRIPPGKLSIQCGPKFVMRRRQVMELAWEIGAIWDVLPSNKNPAGQVFRDLLELRSNYPMYGDWPCD